MKKFLTVLLALSVVFTYSFSSVSAVFAADQTPAEKAQAMVDAKANSVLADTENDKYEDEAVAYAINQAKVAGYNAIKVLINEHTENGELNEKTFYDAVKAWCDTSDGDVDKYPDFMAVFGSAVTAKDCELKVANAKALVNAVNAADYIEADRKAVAEYKDKVLAALDTIKAIDNNEIKNLFCTAVSAEVFGDKANYVDAINIYLYGGESNWNKIYTAESTDKELENALVPGLFGMLLKLTTIAEENENTEINDAYIENILANIKYNAKADFYAAHKVAAKEAVTVADGVVVLKDGTKVYGVKVAKASKITAEEASAINSALMNQIDETLTVVEGYVKQVPAKTEAAKLSVKTELDKQVPFYKDHSNFAAAMDWALKAIEMYEKVVAYGEDMKTEINYVGDKLYNDADIDKAVADAKADIYWNYFGAKYSTNVNSYFSKVMPANDPVEVALKAAIEKWENDADKAAEADKKYCEDYYAAYDAKYSSINWRNEYKEIKADAVAALWEVKTVAEVDEIMAEAAGKLAALRTAANDTAALHAEITDYIDSLKDITAAEWDLVKNKDTYREDAYTDAYNAGTDLIKAVLKAGETKAAYEEAKALFKDIKTTAELKAKAEKVNEMAAKLPGTVTLDKEADFMAAFDAYQAYMGNYGALDNDVIGAYLALDTVMDRLQDLQETAVENAIQELKALAPIKADDKAAVEAVRAMYDKYFDYYAQYGITFSVYNLGDLIAAEEDVYNDEIAVVRKMIAALTDASSLDEVLAARDAYNALSGSQQRAIADAFPYKVQMMTQKIIDSVESLKIQVWTKLYTKSDKIRVNWKVKDGDASAADGFYVYKSTKAHKNYQFMGKTKKSYMDNKKNLKKGNRYYYKVKAYVEIDGQKYFSDDSNKGNRIYK